MWLFAALLIGWLLAVACRRLAEVAPSQRDLDRLRQLCPCVSWLLQQRFDESLWRYRHFGLRLLAIVYLPLRKDLKRLCRGSWRGWGFLIAFDGLYPLLWLKGIVFGSTHDLRVILGLHLLATRRRSN